MAESDNSEWRLLDTDLTTQLAIIPTSNSHLYLELNEPGSGELKLPMLSNAAGLISNGMFCQLSYRGTTPGGFFVDSIKEVDADNNEGAGRWMSVSGRGALALLETAIVWDGGTGGSVREFTSVTKASILKTLIDEAQARGGLSVLTYDFTASLDSNAVAWTDSESYEIPVGTTLLDVARQFAATGGFDYEIILSGGTFNLSAYSAGVGTDKSATVKLRIGVNCEEAGRDERGGVDISNAYLIKYKNGYLTVTDPTSISARMRREKLLSIEQAQTPESAITYASAKLANSKDPLSSKTLRVYDGVAPYLFSDYAMGDTITQDRFGTETADRILGIQADFDGVEFSHVVLEMNAILYDTNLKLEKDLDWLMDQWNTAHDANLLETTFWSAIGGLPISTAPDVYHVSDLLVYNGVLYVSLYLDAHSSTGFNCVYQYELATGIWSNVGEGDYPTSVYRLCQMGGDIYAAGFSDNIGTDPMEIYKWDGTSWTGIGTLNSSGFVNCMATDGTNLYIGADKFGTTVEGVTLSSGVGKWDGASWTSVAASTTSGFCYALLWHGGSLYGGFDNGARKLTAGVWGALTGSTAVRDLQTYGNDIAVAIEGAFPYTYVKTWDGTSAMVQIGEFSTGGVYDRVERLKVNLTDVYAIGDFTVVDGDTGFTNIAKYSGGAWVRVDAGVGVGGSEYGTAIEFSENSLYVGGLFTVVNDSTPAQNLAVRITDFQDAIDFASNNINPHTHRSNEILLDRLGTTVEHDLQYMQTVVHSAGWVSGGAISDNGDGTIAITAGVGLLRATDNNLSNLFFVAWPADSVIALTNTSINWVYIDYNAGSPIAVASTSEPTDYNTRIRLAKIYRNGTSLYINATIRQTVGDHAGLMLRSMAELMPFAWVSGAAISAVGTTQFSITAGVWWNGLTRFTTGAFDGTTETFNLYYRNGSGGWTEATGQTAINNTQYDDGDGTLGTLTANRYGVHWIYLATDDAVHDVMGQGDYTLAQAQAATVPSTIPPELQVTSRLAAKIIIKKSDTTFTSLETYIGMDTASPSGTGSVHNDLSGLQGGTASEYYHLTSAQYTQLTDGWISTAVAVTSGTLDSPSFELSFAADMTTLIGVGDRIKLTQSTVKYFIVTKVGAYSAGATIITGYGGTDYTLVASGTTAISNVFYSHTKAPFGFPLAPAKWTVSASNTANAHKTPPTANTWYGGAGLTNTGISVDVPIGVWDGFYKTVLESEDTTVTDYNIYCTLSVTNSTETDTNSTFFVALTVPSGTYKIWSVVSPPITFTCTAKTTAYLNIKTSTSTADAIHMRGDVVPTIIKLVCAYL